MKTSKEQQFYDMGAKLLTPYTRAKDMHETECLTCGHTWETRPHTISQAYKNKGNIGCPQCYQNRKDGRHVESRELVKDTLEEKGLECLTEGYKFQQAVRETLMFRNTKCNHVFESTITNILYNNVMCPVCTGHQANKAAFDENGEMK